MNQQIKALLIMLFAFTTHWVQAQSVAKVGTTEFATLQEALDAAQTGETVKLLGNVDATGTMYSGDNRFNLWVSKGITLDGDGHTLKVNGRGIGVQGASSNIDVTFRNITITNHGNANGRCIDTRGKIGSLTLNNAKLTTAESSYTGFLQPLTIGSNQTSAATVNIINSEITVVEAANKGYAITTFNPVNMTINGSTIKGWACFNIKGPDSSAGSSGSTITVENSTLVSANGTPGYSNAYSLVKIEDDNISVNITSSNLNINGGGNTQSLVSFQKLNLSSSANCHVSLGAGNNITLQGDYKFASNVGNSSELTITGGTFNVEVPEEYLAEGYICTENNNGTWTVGAIPMVAQIGTQKYPTIDDAVAAANEGETIEVIAAGDYKLPGLPKNVTIEGKADGEVSFTYTTVNGSIASVPNGATFKNVTFYWGNVNYHGFQHAGTINMEGCTLDGKFFSYGDMNFTDCSFTQSNSDYHMWTYSGNVTYTGCTFTNSQTGKFINVYNESGATKYTVTATNCTFINNASSPNKAALNIKATCGNNLLAYDVIINNCSTEGSFPEASSSDALVVLNSLAQVDDRTASGVDNITVTQDGVLIYPATVAAIGETRYPTLQAAVNAAQQMGGEVTVNIIDNISEETVTINEVANFKLTIDGKKDDSSNYTVDAVIAVDGLRGNGGSTTNGSSVTLQNIDFVKTTATDGIQATAYPHDLTIQDCTYKGFDNDKWFLNASVNGPLYGVTVKNVTVENARLIYAHMAEDAVFENITATNNVKVGFNVKTSGTALIKDCQVTTGKYAFRDITDAYEGTFTLQDNTFISTTSASDEGVIVNRGGAVGTAHINVVSGTYTGPVKVLSNKEGVLAISGGYFSEEFPQDYIAADLVAQGKVCVPATNMEGYFTIGDPHYVAQIGETKYVTLPAALEAANNGETILLLDDIDMGSDYVSINKAVTINGDGHSITSSAAAAVEVSGTGDVTISNTEINATSGRGVQVGNVAHYSGNLTINEGTVITVAKRGINVLDVDEGFALNVNGSIIQTNMADPTTTYTIGEESRGINFSNDPLAFTANITNSEIRGFSYCTNIYSGAESLTLNITGGKSYGRDVVNNWGKNNTFNLDGVEVHGLNNQTGPTEAFACIVENAGSANNIYNINNCQFIATLSDDAINTANTSASEYLIDLRGNNTKVVITGTTSYTTNAAEKGGFIEYEPYIDNNTIMMDETAANTFANAFKEYKIEETEVAPGYIVTKKVYVAQIGEVKYETLEAAWAAVQDGETITLLADCAGNGIKAPQGKFSTGVTIDFDGHTYTMDGELVGSTGTETQAFQLLKDNKITFKNGTIYSEKAKMLVQNYSDLTLEGMTLTLANENYSSAYTLSNNNGNVVIDGTTINANTGGGFAFDVCRYASYPSVNVTVTGDSEINGNVEVSASGSDAKDGFSLMLESGTINGDLVIDPTAATAMANTPEKAQVMENDDFGQAAPYGFKWESIGEGVSKLVAMEYVAQIGNVKYYSLADAVSAVPTDGTETTITMIANEMIDVVGYAITIPATKNVVLDLNGFEVVGTASEGNTSALITNLGTLTIKDSSDTNKDGTGTGKLMSGATTTWTWDGSDDYAGSYASNLIRNEKNLIVESGLLYNMSSGSAAYAIDNYSAGNVTINGGNIDAAKASAIRMFYVNGGSLSVTDGVIGRYNSDDDCTYMGIQVMSGTNVNVSVTGGSIAGDYAFYANNTGGKIDISDGAFDGYVAFGSAGPSDISISGGSFNTWVGTWGNQTKFISGGIYADEVDEEYIADGYILSDNTDEATKDDYPYTVRIVHYVAQIGTTKYESLAEAIAVVGDDETITMLCDVDNAGGLSVPSGKNFTVDFDGHTYTLNKPGAGSTGTETIGFQLLKNSTIVFKNGTINISEDNLTEAILPAKNIKRIIQNYANLTLEDMTIDGTNQFGGNTYVVSFNNGTSSIIGNTSIIAGETGQRPIMDIDINNSYTGTNVTINTTGVIGGDIETSAISQEKADACSLTITNADVLGTITKGSSYDVPVSVSGGIYDEEVQEEFCAVGYVCVPTDNNRYTVKTKEDAGIFDLVDWEDYPYTEEKEATQVTYTRKFNEKRVGNPQPWYVPFDYEITDEDAENFDFYKIDLIAASSSTETGELSDNSKIFIHILKVDAHTVLKANRPYVLKPQREFDGDNAYVFKAQDVTLVVPDTETSRLHHETSRYAVDFKGTYAQGRLSSNKEPEKCITLSASGTYFWMTASTRLNAYRWYAHVTDKSGYDDYSNLIFVMGEDDTTGISTFNGVDANEIEGIYTLGGVKLETPARGVNIIKFTNGTTKKVYIK